MIEGGVEAQWQINNQKFLGCAPNQTNSFVFTYVFAKKHMHWRSAHHPSPPTRISAPMGDPGSVPDMHSIYGI